MNLELEAGRWCLRKCDCTQGPASRRPGHSCAGQRFLAADLSGTPAATPAGRPEWNARQTSAYLEHRQAVVQLPRFPASAARRLYRRHHLSSAHVDIGGGQTLSIPGDGSDFRGNTWAARARSPAIAIILECAD